MWTFLVYTRNIDPRCSPESSTISTVPKMKGKNTRLENLRQLLGDNRRTLGENTRVFTCPFLKVKEECANSTVTGGRRLQMTQKGVQGNEVAKGDHAASRSATAAVMHASPLTFPFA